MVIVQRLLHIGKSPISGITYTREVLEGLLEAYKSQTTPLMVEVPDTGEIDFNNNFFQINLDRVAGVVEEMYLDDEGLVVHTKLLETPMGIVLTELFSSMQESDDSLNDYVMKVSPNMVGTIETLDDGTVIAKDLKLHSVRFEPK